VFCIDGPLLELPAVLRTERLTIHVETIDLARADDVAHRETLPITVEEASGAVRLTS
jgi:hypothetical protein